MSSVEGRTPPIKLKEISKYNPILRSKLSLFVGEVWTLGLVRKIHDSLSLYCPEKSSSLFRSLLTWFEEGKVFRSEEATALSWLLAANVSRLKFGEVVFKPLQLLSWEWAAVQFRRVSGITDKGIGFEFLVVSGSLAGVRFLKAFTSRHLYALSFDLGFSRFVEEKRWNSVVESLIRLMLLAKLEPTKDLTALSFKEYQVTSSLLKQNKATINFRSRECERGLQGVACVNCNLGFEDCPGSCRETGVPDSGSKLIVEGFVDEHVGRL